MHKWGKELDLIFTVLVAPQEPEPISGVKCVPAQTTHPKLLYATLLPMRAERKFK